jgi:hypothetical protein
VEKTGSVQGGQSLEVVVEKSGEELVDGVGEKVKSKVCMKPMKCHTLGT